MGFELMEHRSHSTRYDPYRRTLVVRLSGYFFTSLLINALQARVSANRRDMMRLMSDVHVTNVSPGMTLPDPAIDNFSQFVEYPVLGHLQGRRLTQTTYKMLNKYKRGSARTKCSDSVIVCDCKEPNLCIHRTSSV
jgi:hypothetical protein